ncbi:MAG: hypothetical protein KZQ65_03280 [Candidatus Thiodiazotropha sp. (ex Gloverina cf. vestifex)]|nr:hypothetical protein [Candidatus Thiodiazotropha sp. (ex Gloverina cf. vestifex)]
MTDGYFIQYNLETCRDDRSTSGPGKGLVSKKKTWVISTGLLILSLLILISLPFGISFGLADFLKQHGARQVRIENIDFNPFTGRLLFQNVRAQVDEAQDLRLDRLELEMGWRDLFSKEALNESFVSERFLSLASKLP